MPGSRQTEHRSWIYSAAYAVASALIIITILTNEGDLSDRLSQGFVGILILLILPATGFLMQLIGRRFWAWPYVYLLAVYLIHSGQYADVADRIYHYSSQVTTVVTLSLAEILGLSLGRWLNRPIGIGYFTACGLLLLFYAGTGSELFGAVAWQGWVFGLGGVLFLVQAIIQLYNNQLASKAVLESPDEELEVEPGENENTSEEERRVGDEPPSAEGSQGQWTIQTLEADPIEIKDDDEDIEVQVASDDD